MRLYSLTEYLYTPDSVYWAWCLSSKCSQSCRICIFSPNNFHFHLWWGLFWYFRMWLFCPHSLIYTRRFKRVPPVPQEFIVKPVSNDYILPENQWQNCDRRYTSIRLPKESSPERAFGGNFQALVGMSIMQERKALTASTKAQRRRQRKVGRIWKPRYHA